jgi:hypothetical protein
VGLEVLSDSFVRARLDDPSLSGRHPASRVLDALSRQLRCRWRKEGNLVLIRDEMYFADRPVEVPARILRAWKPAPAETSVSLERLATLAAALNDDQARGMYRLWGWYLEGTGIGTFGPAYTFYMHLHDLRFWASLSPSERASALSGAVLPTRRMSPPQRSAFLSALLRSTHGEGIGPPPVPRPFTAEDVGTGAFRLETREIKQQRLRVSYPGGIAMILSHELKEGELPPTRFGDYPAEPVGPPTVLDGYTFQYLLGGREKPAHTAHIQIARPAVVPPPAESKP